MSGFGFPRDWVAEAYFDGWTDVSTEVRQTEPITITRGRGDQQDLMVPGKMLITMENGTGDWSPQNPMGSRYGLLGPNTPWRYSLRAARDTFGRVTSNGWGNATTGQPWNLEGAASQFATNGSVGTQQVAAASAHVNAWITQSLADNYAAVDYTPGFTDVTGGSIEPANIMLRHTDVNNYYLVRVIVTTTEAYEMQVIRRRAGVETTLSTTNIGLSHVVGQTVRVAGMIDGITIFGKIWMASGPEPYDWHMIVEDTDELNVLRSPGDVGIRSGVAAGNTNAKPITFTYDNLDVRVMRMSGEIAEITQEWDEAHANMFARVQVLGPLRRLVQGNKTAPLRSTLRRAFDTASSNVPVAYWPGEDTGGPNISSGLSTGYPMEVLEGNISFASFSDFICTAPVPTSNNSRWYGPVAPYTDSAGQAQSRFLMAVPSTGTPPDDSIIMQQYTTGTAQRWEIHYHTGGALSVNAYNAANTNILASGPLGAAVDGKMMYVSLELDQNGANIDWALVVYEIDGSAVFWNGTLNTNVLGRVTDLNFGVGANLGSVAFGFMTVQSQISSIFDMFTSLIAWTAEEAGERFQRLCNENGIQWVWRGGNPDNTTSMGPQLVKTLLELLRECADAEQSILCECRSYFALQFRTMADLSAQDETMLLDYSAKHIAAPFKPAEGDRGLVNDVLATQTRGGEFRAVQTSGPRNIHDPWSDPDGVGRFEKEVPVNTRSPEQLKDIATFARALGTTPEPRFPSMTLLLRSPNLTEAINAQALATNIGDRVVVQHLGQIFVFDNVDQMVQGYTEVITDVHQHSITYNLTPYGPFRTLVLDDADARLDSDASSLGEDLDTTETSVDVTSTGDTRWITTALHPTMFPFNAKWGGEEVTVTAIVGTGATQTFTVIRSVNDVIKEHLAGTPVNVAYPVYLGRFGNVP